MIRYKIIKATRRLRILFGGYKSMERKHYLFTLSKVLTPQEISERLWKDGWGYNTLSTTHKGQIFTVRKVVPPRYQYHLRFYKDGAVSGHFEVDPIQFPLEHLDGVDLRGLNEEETSEIKSQLV